MRNTPASARSMLARRASPRAPRGRAASRIAAVGALALLSAATIGVAASGETRADHDNTYVICPDPVEEGNSTQMGVRRSGFEVPKVTVFSDHGGHTADSDDYSEYHGVGFEQPGDTTLQIPIETTEDTQPEHNETFAIGFWSKGDWHGCVVTIVDDDGPRVTGVHFGSSPADGWAYRAGDPVDIVVSLDARGEVVGSPLLALYVGESDSTWRGARYHSGSNTRELVFRYLVRPEDLDLDGMSVGAAAAAEDRTPAYGFTGTITAPGTDVPIAYRHSGIDPVLSQRVDGRPYVKSARVVSVPEAGANTYRANETIEFAFVFNTRVVVDGDACVTLSFELGHYDWLGAWRQAEYRRGSGTDTLVFGYTVRPGDTAPRGIVLVTGNETSGFCGGGTIKAEGTDVDRNPWYPGTDHQGGHRVDTTPPTAGAVTILSRPAKGEAYTTGETIRIEVTFSEDVVVSGTPYLVLDIGAATGRATLAADRIANNGLIFEYAVQPGDADNDGVGIGANSLYDNSGGIRDRAGNTADLSHNVVAADAGQQVAGSAAG